MEDPRMLAEAEGKGADRREGNFKASSTEQLFGIHPLRPLDAFWEPCPRLMPALRVCGWVATREWNKYALRQPEVHQRLWGRRTWPLKSSASAPAPTTGCGSCSSSPWWPETSSRQPGQSPTAPRSDPSWEVIWKQGAR